MKQNYAETIAQLNRALAHDFRIMPLYAPDAPIFLAVALPSAEGVTGLKPRLPAGRGLTVQQAMISAGAEALELRASLAQHHAAALAGLPKSDGLAITAAKDLRTDETVSVLAQEVFLDGASVLSEPLVHDANSTGCAVGPNREKATITALWECVERDAVALWWHGHMPPGPLSLDLIDSRQPRLYWWLHQRARSTMLLDLTTDIGLPVVAAVSSDPDGRLVAMGSAARSTLSDATLAAITEMVQTEVSLEQAREAEHPEFAAWQAHASTTTQAQFQPGGAKAAAPVPVAKPDGLLHRLDQLGHRALAVELTLPDDPLPCMRVLVPGLCAMAGRTDTPRFERLCPGQPPLHLPEPF
jgi:thiazole/oxazole-forming peptide maturase SagD family component